MNQASKMEYFYHLFLDNPITVFLIGGHHANKNTIYDRYSPFYDTGTAKSSPSIQFVANGWKTRDDRPPLSGSPRCRLLCHSRVEYSDEQASRTNQLISDGFLTSTPPDLNERVEFRNFLRMSSLPQLPGMTPSRLHAILVKYSALRRRTAVPPITLLTYGFPLFNLAQLNVGRPVALGTSERGRGTSDVERNKAEDEKLGFAVTLFCREGGLFEHVGTTSFREQSKLQVGNGRSRPPAL